MLRKVTLQGVPPDVVLSGLAQCAYYALNNEGERVALANKLSLSTIFPLPRFRIVYEIGGKEVVMKDHEVIRLLIMAELTEKKEMEKFKAAAQIKNNFFVGFDADEIRTIPELAEYAIHCVPVSAFLVLFCDAFGAVYRPEIQYAMIGHKYAAGKFETVLGAEATDLFSFFQVEEDYVVINRYMHALIIAAKTPATTDKEKEDQEKKYKGLWDIVETRPVTLIRYLPVQYISTEEEQAKDKTA